MRPTVYIHSTAEAENEMQFLTAVTLTLMNVTETAIANISGGGS